MRLIGLTGGIASGKSTVSRMLREKGAEIIDADLLAREVVEPGQPALLALAQAFPEVIDANGRLNRPALAAKVFGDLQLRRQVNALTHPHIQKLFTDRKQALIAAQVPVAFYDVPLLFENQLQSQMDGVLLIYLPHDVQISRLMARDGLSQSDAEQRIRSQMSLEDKKRMATWIIDNSRSLDDTRQQLDALWPQLVG